MGRLTFPYRTSSKDLLHTLNVENVGLVLAQCICDLPITEAHGEQNSASCIPDHGICRGIFPPRSYLTAFGLEPEIKLALWGPSVRIDQECLFDHLLIRSVGIPPENSNCDHFAPCYRLKLL